MYEIFRRTDCDWAQALFNLLFVRVSVLSYAPLVTKVVSRRAHCERNSLISWLKPLLLSVKRFCYFKTTWCLTFTSFSIRSNFVQVDNSLLFKTLWLPNVWIRLKSTNALNLFNTDKFESSGKVISSLIIGKGHSLQCFR